MLAKYGEDNCKLLFTDSDSFAIVYRPTICTKTLRLSPTTSTLAYIPKITHCTVHKMPRCWVNLKTNVTQSLPWSLWGCIPKFTRCWYRGSLQKWQLRELKNPTSKITWHTTYSSTFWKTGHVGPYGTNTAKFLNFRSRNHHQHRSDRTVKICLSAYDDKRYILEAGKNSLSYDNKDIPWTVGNISHRADGKCNFLGFHNDAPWENKRLLFRFRSGSLQHFYRSWKEEREGKRKWGYRRGG